jgi:hypothetical protein
MTEEQSAKQVAIIIGELAETNPVEYLRMVHLVTSRDDKCHETLSGAGAINAQ